MDTTLLGLITILGTIVAGGTAVALLMSARTVKGRVAAGTLFLPIVAGFVLGLSAFFARIDIETERIMQTKAAELRELCGEHASRLYVAKVKTDFRRVTARGEFGEMLESPSCASSNR